jgi:predicted transcriptional regulator
MKLIICYFSILLVLTNTISAQKLHHQMTSAQGKSTYLKSGHYVSQTIGQQSIIGTGTSKKFSIHQGFQQSAWAQLITKNSAPLDITISTYPNPFVNDVTFKFSKHLKGAIQLFVFDTSGRLLFVKNTLMGNNTINENLYFLSSGTYLVQIKNKKITHYTKIIKI